jgi:hypothetical protein
MELLIDCKRESEWMGEWGSVSRRPNGLVNERASERFKEWTCLRVMNEILIFVSKFDDCFSAAFVVVHVEGVKLSLICGHQRDYCSSHGWYENMESPGGMTLKGETGKLWEKPFPVPLFQPQIPHGPHIDRPTREPGPPRWEADSCIMLLIVECENNFNENTGRMWKDAMVAYFKVYVPICANIRHAWQYE